MKKFFSILMAVMLAARGLGADAANDLILSQRKADNSGSIQRNVTGTANALVAFSPGGVAASTLTPSVTSITLSSLTSGRVPFATTAGLITDDPDMTFATDTLTVTKGTLGGITLISNAIAASASLTAKTSSDLTVNAYGVGGVSDKNIYLAPNGWGHVGIGDYASTIALPGAPNFFAKQLHIADFGGSGVFADTVAGTTTFTGRFTGNLPGSPTAVPNLFVILSLDSLGYDGAAYSTTPTSLRFRASQTWTSTAHGTGMELLLIANDTTSQFSAFTVSNLGQLASTPKQPASVAATPGTTSGTGFSFAGAAGGNTTIATTGAGGIGSAISLTGGTGGTAAAAVTASTGGAGGAVTIASGAGGAAAVSGSGTGTGGNAGTFTMSTGTGGAASTSTGVNLGGTGGSWTFTTGNGGAATSGSSNTGGNAGNITLTTGNGGAGATAAGNSGTLNLVTGTAGSGGTVGNIIFKVGNVQALAVSGGAAATLTGGAGNMTITAGTGASRTLTLQTTTSGSAATTFLSGDASQNTTISKLITSYNGISTAGNGVVAIVKATRVTAQSAANSSICTYTTPASDGSYEVSANMNVTASTTLSTTLTCTYTDESNTARSLILPVTGLTGSFVALGSISGAGASVWETPVMHIRCKASTVITILTSAGTFSGVTYTAEGIIKQTQ